LFLIAYNLLIIQEAVQNRVNATKKDWTTKSRPGAAEIPEFFRKMDKNFEELKNIHEVLKEILFKKKQKAS
jgi:hypothetical protein